MNEEQQMALRAQLFDTVFHRRRRKGVTLDQALQGVATFILTGTAQPPLHELFEDFVSDDPDPEPVPAPAIMISSLSDERTANNVTQEADSNLMRHNYRLLSEDEKANVKIVKDMGANFVRILHDIGGTDPRQDRMASAHLTLSMRHMEDAVYRAVKHITE